MERTEQARCLYDMAVQVKKYDTSKLRWFWNRRNLLYELWRMRNETEALRSSVYEERLSDEYFDLLGKMENILADCEELLWQRSRGYREHVRRNLLAFHNLPRAFLSVADRAKLSPAEAWGYAKTYLKSI